MDRQREFSLPQNLLDAIQLALAHLQHVYARLSDQIELDPYYYQHSRRRHSIRHESRRRNHATTSRDAAVAKRRDRREDESRRHREKMSRVVAEKRRERAITEVAMLNEETTRVIPVPDQAHGGTHEQQISRRHAPRHRDKSPIQGTIPSDETIHAVPSPSRAHLARSPSIQFIGIVASKTAPPKPSRIVKFVNIFRNEIGEKLIDKEVSPKITHKKKANELPTYSHVSQAPTPDDFHDQIL